MLGSKGQTLIELIIVVTVGLIVVGALVFATISSLRNAQFAKNQTQATKFAQEAIEKVRTARDRGDPIGGNFTMGGLLIDSWKDPDLWSQQISSSDCRPICYFKFAGSNFQFLAAASDVPTGAEDILGDKFKRVVILSDDANFFRKQKNITIIVRWNDFSGDHESRLTTILRDISQ